LKVVHPLKGAIPALLREKAAADVDLRGVACCRQHRCAGKFTKYPIKKYGEIVSFL
jgi:hypothetical protein